MSPCQRTSTMLPVRPAWAPQHGGVPASGASRVPAPPLPPPPPALPRCPCRVLSLPPLLGQSSAGLRPAGPRVPAATPAQHQVRCHVMTAVRKLISAGRLHW